MSRILVPSRGPEDWRGLLADPEMHWREGYSAYATAHRWEGAGGLPGEIAAVLGEGAELLLAIPEHKVPLSGGGRASQCDVFALVRLGPRTVAVAVEGKVNETFGPTLGEWLRDASEGKLKRLEAICDTLGLDEQPGDRVRYQLLHRTAAALSEAERFGTHDAAMVVHSFSPDQRWFDDFSVFCELFGFVPEVGRGHTVSLGKRRLTLGWATGLQV